MSAAHHPYQNHLLRALPVGTRNRVFPHLELVEMRVGRELYDGRGSENDVHFPTDSVVAPLHVAKEEFSAQIAVIGNEGMSGCALFVAGEAALTKTVVQCPGHAFKLNGAVLQQECSRDDHLFSLLLTYTRALIGQMTQTVACNLKHPLEQRLCRWLLLTLDRMATNQLPIRQEVIEKVMGEHPTRITETLRVFDALGVIKRDPERLTVPDRRRLELASCACYASVRSALDPPQPPRAVRLIDVFRELTDAVIDGLSSTDQSEFIKQLQGALIRGVEYDLDTDAAAILLLPVCAPRAVRRNVFASAHGRKIPIECRYWVNLDTDTFGRVAAIEIMHPPEPLKQELLDRARL